MKKTSFAVFSAILLATLLACVSTAPPAPMAAAGQPQAQAAQPPAGQPAPAPVTPPVTIQPVSAQPASPYFTGDGGRGMTLAVLEPAGNGLSEDEMRWMPALVQGSMTSDFNMHSAITVIDRQNLETILDQQGLSMMGYFSDEDFIRIGHLANARYVLTGSITRTATVYMIEFAVTDVQTGVRRASHSPTPVSVQAVENLSAVREATISLLGQLGVNLTARGRQQLSRAADIADVQAQTALARGITAQRQGFEVEALSHFLQAQAHDPFLWEAEDRLETLTAGLARGHFGTDARADIAWRRQWVDRLQEAEDFFVSSTQRQAYFLVYEPSIRDGAINHANETMQLSFWMALVPDPAWADTVNQVTATVASSLRATGRADDWGLDWPYNHVSFSPPFANRANTLAVVAEIVNDRGIVIGRQLVNIPAGFSIHSRVSRRVTPRQWEGNVVFPAVDVHAITDRLTIRVASVNGVPAENVARETGVTVMSNDELFRAARIRRAPVDTSDFVVNANGVLTQWRGSGTEVHIPFMVNGVQVTAIGNGAFANRELIGVTIPDTVTSIGDDAFSRNRLTSIAIPESVSTIGRGAFYRNVLRSIDIPDGIISIGEFTFAHNQLTGIVISDSVRRMGRNAFLGNNLNSITIGAGVVSSSGFGSMFYSGFDTFYSNNGRRAGTYRFVNNAWTFTPR